MNFNCYNYNELILYASAFISGNGYVVSGYGYIYYFPATEGNELFFYQTKSLDERRSFRMSFPDSSHQIKQYNISLLTFLVVNENSALSILSHPHLDKRQRYFFAFAPR